MIIVPENAWSELKGWIGHYQRDQEMIANCNDSKTVSDPIVTLKLTLREKKLRDLKLSQKLRDPEKAREGLPQLNLHIFLGSVDK